MKTEISNKEIASSIINGKHKSLSVLNLKRATAIRVAGHRLGHVLSVVAEAKNKFVITKAKTKVTHRPQPKTKAKPAKKANVKVRVLKKAA